MTVNKTAFLAHYTFTDEPFVVARTPALPVESLTAIFSDESRRSVAELLNDEHVRSAIRVASASLSNAIERGNVNDSSPAYGALLKYLIRMSARSTPFGLFSAVSTIGIGEQTTLKIPDDSFRFYVRPDMPWLLNFVDSDVEVSSQRAHLRLATSKLLSRRGNRIIVLNPRKIRGVASAESSIARLDYAEVSLNATAAAEYAINYAQEPTPHRTIAQALANHFGEDLTSAEQLVNELMECGLLVPETHVYPIAATLDDLLHGVLRPLADNRKAQVMELFSVVGNKTGFTIGPDTSGTITTLLERLLSLAPVPTVLGTPTPPIQVDSVRYISGNLGASILEDASTLASLLMRRTAQSIGSLATKFADLYGSYDVEVPLLELLDSLHGMEINSSSHVNASSDVDQHAIGDAKLELASKALADGATCVDLVDSDLDHILPPVDPEVLPSSFEVGFDLLASSFQDVQSGRYELTFSGYNSLGAMRSVSRFAWTFDDSVLSRMQKLENLQAERDSATRCELVVDPSLGRALNVSIRPRLASQEIRIGYEANAGLPEALGPKDILIGFDGKRFFARDRRSGRRLSIVETHNLNIPNTAPVVGRFLSLLRSDGYIAGLAFDWGVAARLPRLPRLRYGRVVLSPALWRLRRETVLEALEKGGSNLRQWSVPRWIQTGEFDSKLPLDLDSTVGRRMLASIVRKASTPYIEFEEFLPTPERCWLSNEHGKHFRCEFIASAIRVSRAQAITKSVLPPQSYHPKVFAFGSEWTYAKIYCSEDDVASILETLVLPIIKEFKSTTEFVRWFFVRYSDPRFHIRLRVRRRGDGLAFLSKLGSSLQAAIDRREIASVVFDAYRPEEQRYGGAVGLERCEEIFEIDSECVAQRLINVAPDQELSELVAQTAMNIIWPFARRLEPFVPNMISSKRVTLYNHERVAATHAAEHWLKLSSAEVISPYESAVAKLFEVQDSVSASHEKLLNALVHMHCNRFGIDNELERRVRAIIFQGLRSARVSNRVATGSIG